MAKYDHAKAIEYLTRKWQGRPCPMCGSGPWNVQDSTYQLLEFQQGGLILGGPVLPIIPVMCGNCGNTVMVNAIVAGVVEAAAAPTAPPALAAPQKAEIPK